MKKNYSLLRACMTSDMNIFKIKKKKNGKKSNIMLPLLIAFLFMFSIWSNANILFEKMAPMHLQFVVLSLFVLLTTIMTFIEGIYKSGPLMFNCKDDQLLLSLPIKRSTILFIRIFKFYVFELLFNSLFMIPFVVAYIIWADTLDWTFFLTSLVMLFTLPIIPIVLSCIIGSITSSIIGKFKYKNIAQIIFSMTFCILIMYLSFSLDSFYEYLIQHSKSVSDFITKIYYPAGLYANLTIKFDPLDLIIFVLVNILLMAITIFVLSKFYFKINSRLKKVTTTKKVFINQLKIESHSIYQSLIKKEFITFFTTPVFIINAGFGLVLFILGTIGICMKFDSLLLGFTDPNGMNISKELIMNNLSLLIFGLIAITAYMTSITNSVISLEGRNINILKSLPVSTRKILMSKIYSSLLITTPVLFLGDVILFFKFKTNIIDILLLLILSILVPLVSHFIGILVNLKYPKLEFENSAEVVKQSMSSFVAVMIGMILAFVTFFIITKVAGTISTTLLLFITMMIYVILDFILYQILIHIGVRQFNRLSI